MHVRDLHTTLAQRDAVADLMVPVEASDGHPSLNTFHGKRRAILLLFSPGEPTDDPSDD
ncbi:MAG: hypothetical protein JO100_14740 [Pseudonocardia sp.]|nr:hypothetical protein [Pseudonocardia sp.]